MKLTENELFELRYHYVDRYVESQPDAEFLDEAQNYWEEHFDDVVKDIKEYANSDIKKSLEDREASNIFIDINNTGGKY